MPSKKRPLARRVRDAFDPAALSRICALPEWDFAATFRMQTVPVGSGDFYHFRDNGASVLAVAHLDTVAAPGQRAAHFATCQAGPVVFSRALDDRLGAYIILELLPALGITYDWLLTTGEETGQSTAQHFAAPKDYDWIIEFDRGGTDVVMYQYDDEDTRLAVKAAGARVGEGIFTDICYLDHLGVKGFNWGTGYEDYHSARSHAFLNDTFDMVGKYLRFHALHAGTAMPHSGWDDNRAVRRVGSATACTLCLTVGSVDPVTLFCEVCKGCQDCREFGSDCQCYAPAPPAA